MEWRVMTDAPAPKASKRPVFRLLLRPEPNVDGESALRRALKVLLRRFGLRCVSVERVQP
jgi:hypothetical protein